MIEKEIEEFETFVNHYDLSVPAIERKYKHSLRVMKFAIDIAKSLNLTEDEIILAAKAGLLHDIGRFEQWTQYCTYNDLKSIDHADLGVEILKKNNYIEKYEKDKVKQRIILTAVKNHNKLAIEQGIDGIELIISKIIRDADKLDIMNTQILAVKDVDSDFNIDTLQYIYLEKCCANSAVKSEVDSVVRMLCFIFDLYYKYSIKYLQQVHLVKKKINILEQYNNVPKDEIEKIKEYILQYMKRKIEEN